MGDVKSKNMYELLGNDPEQDSDREPEPPAKAIDKPVPRAGKRAGPEAAPARASHPERERGGRRGGRGGQFTGNEAAFKEPGTGSTTNRRQGVPDDVRTDRHPNRIHGHNLETRRGGHGGRGGRGKDDRHNHGRADHPKQGDLAWGAPTGEAELKDETAGEAIASQELKQDPDANVPPPVDADGKPIDEAQQAEERQKSYAEYLAEQAEKKLQLGNTLEARKANEGSKADQKWANAKPLDKNKEDEEAYIAGSGTKAKREREQKAKQVLEIDHSWNESSQRSERGGAGRGRGRGEFRGGDRGRGGERGRGRGRGDGEYRGRGARGARDGQQVNVTDQSAFPSLGGK